MKFFATRLALAAMLTTALAACGTTVSPVDAGADVARALDATVVADTYAPPSGGSFPVYDESIVGSDAPGATDAPPQAPADGGTYAQACASAPELVVNTDAVFTSVFAPVSVPTCFGGSDLSPFPQVVRVVVPAHATVELTSRNDHYVQTSMSFFDDCASTTCAFRSSTGVGDLVYPAVARLVNDSAAPRSYIVVVGVLDLARDPASLGTVHLSMTARFVTTPTNATCATALSMVSGDLRPHEDPYFPTTYDPSPACSLLPRPAGVGPLWYRVVVPVAHTLVVTAAPDALTYIPTVMLYDGCAATDCVAGQLPTGTPPDSNVLRWTNSGAASREIFIAVAGQDGPGRFSLAVSVVPGA